MPTFDELVRVRTIGPYVSHATGSSPSQPLRSGLPHTDGDDLPGDDEPRSRDTVDLLLDTHWSRILHFDLRTGYIGAQDADPANAREHRPAPASIATSTASASASARRGRQRDIRAAARACSAVLAFVAAAYLVVAGLGQLTSPEAAAALGPALPAVQTAPTLPRAASDNAVLRELAFADDHPHPDSSRECAPEGAPDLDCIYP